MSNLGKECAESNKRTGLQASDSERVKVASELLLRAGFTGDIKILGTGHEGVVFSDDKFVYKVFDRPLEFYNDLIEQLEGRFSDCKHFITEMEHFRIEGKIVLKYRQETSEAYTGGLKDQMQDFLVEAALSGVSIKDVKPSNFRVCSGILKFIDYGWDIIPFNYKDFIFMVQRAYLSINGWANPNFKTLAKKALNTWDIIELNGFNEFFNEVYSKLLNKRGAKKPYSLLRVPENIWIDRMLDRFFGEEERTILDEKSSFWAENPHWLLEKIKLNGKIAIIFGDGEMDIEQISEIRKNLKDGCKVAIVFKNPFFGENSRTLKPLISSLEVQGFNILGVEQSPPRPYLNGMFYSRLIYLEAETFTPCGHDTTLLIKACYQDGGMLRELVKHIVGQLRRPDNFKEVLVVLDSKEDTFLREYGSPKKGETIAALNDLKSTGIIDRYIMSPQEKSEISVINERWFSLKCDESHCIRNIPVTPQLFGFENCKGDYILQVDCDAIIVRKDFSHRYLLDMKKALADENILSVSFNIAHKRGSVFKEYISKSPSYTPEVRFCLIDRNRFLRQRPFPNEIIGGKLAYTWYRAVEKAQGERGLHSLRGGDPRSFYIHPENTVKQNRRFWSRAIESAESGFVPDIQTDKVNLQGSLEDWGPPKRGANFMFIVSGRNLSNEKFLRGWQSIVSQTRDDWGAVIINDNSDNNLHEYIEMTTKQFSEKVTYIHNKSTKVILENIYNAIRTICKNPYSVIVIMDMDDMLLTNDVLSALRKEYLSGADMVVGTALKTTRGILPFVPDFRNPKNERMGDVWIHLRSFRKYLFDAIHEEYFKHDEDWIDKFNELAYTVPISEMAARPKHIMWPLYLWEPGHARDEEHYRLNEITKEIVRRKQSHSDYKPKRIFDEYSLPPGEIVRSISKGMITFIRHAEKEKINYIGSKEKRTTERGQREARWWGSNLPFSIDLFLTSMIERTAETAWCIREGNGSKGKIIPKMALGGLSIKDRKKWEEMKRDLGFMETINRWVEGKVPLDVAEPFELIILKLLESIWEEIVNEKSENTIVVTHDHVIFSLHRLFHKTIRHRIYYLGGFSLTLEDLYTKMVELRTKNVEHNHFRTSMDSIEIDITYRCDMRCNNCDRSCSQAPSDDDMSKEQIDEFLKTSRRKRIEWKRIRIMGGEPMLHPDIQEILHSFEKYANDNPSVEIEIYTNGVKKVQDLMIPDAIKIHSTGKDSAINTQFEPYNLAPRDLLGNREDYDKGCWITSFCGMGLNKYGYYPCAAGAAIDRVFGFDIGKHQIPGSEKEFSEIKLRLCPYCGHFLGHGGYVRPPERISISNLQPMTKTWTRAYSDFRDKKPNLTPGGRI
jgi:uncharacterized radical SAM superfamily Fe-S cluster-containing enzyme